MSSETTAFYKKESKYWKGLQEETSRKLKHLRSRLARSEEIERENRELRLRVEKLEKEIAFLKKRLFGRKSEKIKEGTPAEKNRGRKTKRRGRRRGTAGSGRKVYDHLPTEERQHDLAEEEKVCLYCGLPYGIFFKTEDSEEIDFETRVIRIVHHRRVYQKTCSCGKGRSLIVAPGPAKLIPKGLFTTNFWAHILVEKFHLQRPMCRVIESLRMHELELSQGTLTGGLKRIKEQVIPFYEAILLHNRESWHRHMDETSWRVFEDVEGKAGNKWWMWISLTSDSCVYHLDPSRSREVILDIIGAEAHGVISSDRYPAYENVSDEIKSSWCWAHVRRDFDGIREGIAELKVWSETWLERIRELFKLNGQRVRHEVGSKDFQEYDLALRGKQKKMKRRIQEELYGEKGLHEEQKKALRSLEKHWDGLWLFLDYPEIPMDNNAAERGLRNPVVGRKNYYGSGAEWSGLLAAMLFSIFATWKMAGLSPLEQMKNYLNACAENGGVAPKNLTPFLPWKTCGKTGWASRDSPCLKKKGA